MATRKTKVTIIHNSRCSKSRDGMCVIEKLNDDYEVEIIEYMNDPLSIDEIKGLLKKLRLPVEELIRKNEPLFKEKFSGKNYNEDQWIKILHKNPVLIERPIIVKGDKAIIGRPTEKIAEFLGK